MMTVTIAVDLLRQALARKWFLGLGLAMTLGLAVLGLSLRMDVVDGVLAGIRLFGNTMPNVYVSADLAMRPIFQAFTYFIFYGFSGFLVLACSDFAPRLFAPGRIEHLLSLPIRRFEIIVGTYLGVWLLATLCMAYGASGMVVVLGMKTGVWTVRPMVSALLGSFAFATLYAAMLASSVIVRSAAIATATGGVLFVFGIFAGYRDTLLPLWNEGFGKRIFAVLTLVTPRLSSLGEACASLSASRPISYPALFSLIVGFVLFSSGCLAFAIWIFEQKDY